MKIEMNGRIKSMDINLEFECTKDELTDLMGENFVNKECFELIKSQIVAERDAALAKLEKDNEILIDNIKQLQECLHNYKKGELGEE